MTGQMTLSAVLSKKIASYVCIFDINENNKYNAQVS